MTSRLGSGSAIEDSVSYRYLWNKRQKSPLFLKNEPEKSDYDYGDCD